MQRVLLLARVIPDRRPRGYFTASSRGSRYCDKCLSPSRHERLTCCQQSQQLIKGAAFGAYDQRFRSVNGATPTNGDYGFTVCSLAPEALISAAQLSHIWVRLHIFDEVYQAIAQQTLNTFQETQATSFRKNDQRDFLMVCEGNQFLQAAVAVARIDRVVETSSHDDSLVLLLLEGVVIFSATVI
ncbi:hypothetical protein D3C79_563150 [compost metagenome]